jgi:hypothetical protein
MQTKHPKEMTADELRELIGEPPEGSHPDEIMPRAETFHAERLNALQEIYVLRDTLAHQKVAYEEAVSRREFDDEEVGRWQDEIRKTVIKLSGAPDHSIDGGGCDSGDPLDLTLTEIRQGFNQMIDQRDALVAACKDALAKMEAAWDDTGVCPQFDPDDLEPLRTAIAAAPAL